jgi:hypothetical protein
MTINDLIILVANKLASLNNALATATALGNLEDVLRLQDEIEATETTLDQLRSL